MLPDVVVVFWSFSLRNDLVLSIVDRIILPLCNPPLVRTFSSCGVLTLIMFLIEGERVFRFESHIMTEPLLFLVD